MRTNQSYRDFLARYFSEDTRKEQSFLVAHAAACKAQGNPIFFDERLPNGSLAHFLARWVSTNEINGAVAVEIALLSIGNANEETTYANIARALAIDYHNIYCVDLNTEDFIEYRSPVGKEGLAIERHGKNFFAETRRDAMTRVYETDREAFLARFTKENIVRELDERSVYTTSYEIVEAGVPIRANMKISRMGSKSSQIIIGVSVADA